MGDTFFKTFDKDGNILRQLPAFKLNTISKSEYLRGVSCLIVQDDNLLFQKRSGQQDGAGRLDFCSGKVNGNETSDLAMIRELSEEMGIKKEISQNIAHLHSYSATIDKRDLVKNWLIDFYYLQIPPDYEIVIQKSEIDTILTLPLPKAFNVIRNDKRFLFPQDDNFELMLKKFKGHLFLDKMCGQAQTTKLLKAANVSKVSPASSDATRLREQKTL